MKELVQDVIDGKMTISEMMEKVSREKQHDLLEQKHTIDELWAELHRLNRQKEETENQKTA